MLLSYGIGGKILNIVSLLYSKVKSSVGGDDMLSGFLFVLVV